MAIVLNKPLPEFEANATSGLKVSNISHVGQTVILFFYPKDNTPGCTTEAMQFRDKYKDFVKAGALERLSYFYHEESCGQCTPCREGTGWLWRIVHRIEHGEGRPEDLDLLNDVAANIQGRTICALGDAAAMPVRGMLKHYMDEFAYHVEHKRCLDSAKPL